MKRLVARCRAGSRGAGLTEYVLLVLVGVMLVLSTVWAMGDQLRGLFSVAGNSLAGVDSLPSGRTVQDDRPTLFGKHARAVSDAGALGDRGASRFGTQSSAVSGDWDPDDPWSLSHAGTAATSGSSGSGAGMGQTISNLFSSAGQAISGLFDSLPKGDSNSNTFMDEFYSNMGPAAQPAVEIVTPSGSAAATVIRYNHLAKNESEPSPTWDTTDPASMSNLFASEDQAVTSSQASADKASRAGGVLGKTQPGQTTRNGSASGKTTRGIAQGALANNQPNRSATGGSAAGRGASGALSGANATNTNTGGSTQMTEAEKAAYMTKWRAKQRQMLEKGNRGNTSAVGTANAVAGTKTTRPAGAKTTTPAQTDPKAATSGRGGGKNTTGHGQRTGTAGGALGARGNHR